jgi:hypothetical protein
MLLVIGQPLGRPRIVHVAPSMFRPLRAASGAYGQPGHRHRDESSGQDEGMASK